MFFSTWLEWGRGRREDNVVQHPRLCKSSNKTLILPCFAETSHIQLDWAPASSVQLWLLDHLCCLPDWSPLPDAIRQGLRPLAYSSCPRSQLVGSHQPTLTQNCSLVHLSLLFFFVFTCMKVTTFAESGFTVLESFLTHSFWWGQLHVCMLPLNLLCAGASDLAKAARPYLWCVLGVEYYSGLCRWTLGDNWEST